MNFLSNVTQVISVEEKFRLGESVAEDPCPDFIDVTVDEEDDEDDKFQSTMERFVLIVTHNKSALHILSPSYFSPSSTGSPSRTRRPCRSSPGSSSRSASSSAARRTPTARGCLREKRGRSQFILAHFCIKNVLHPSEGSYLP